jgi:hypothetical protein
LRNSRIKAADSANCVQPTSSASWERLCEVSDREVGESWHDSLCWCCNTRCQRYQSGEEAACVTGEDERINEVWVRGGDGISLDGSVAMAVIL